MIRAAARENTHPRTRASLLRPTAQRRLVDRRMRDGAVQAGLRIVACPHSSTAASAAPRGQTGANEIDDHGAHCATRIGEVAGPVLRADASHAGEA